MKENAEMTEKQAERVIEEFENGSRNGEEWAHDVCLHRGTAKYEKSIWTLNEAFRIKSMNRLIRALPVDSSIPLRKRARR